MTTASEITREQLFNTAINHLNRKHSEQRYAILRQAGVPVDDVASLRAWIARTADELAEAAGRAVVYYADTARVKNGVTPGLPTRRGIGCRVTRIELSAYIDRGLNDMRRRCVTWSIARGNPCGGILGTAVLVAAKTAAPAEIARQQRQRLIERGDCFLTYAEAATAAIRQLIARTSRT